MKSIIKIKDILDKNKEELKKTYKVKDIGIFGSYARGEQKKQATLTFWLNLMKR